MIKKILTVIIFLLVVTCATYAQETNSPPRIYRTVSVSATIRTGYLSVIDALTLTEIKRVEFDQPGYIIQVTPDQKRAFIINFSGALITKGVTVIDLVRGFKERELFSDINIAGMRLAPDGLLWVLLPDQQQIAFIDSKTLEAKTPMTAGGIPRDIIFSPDKKIAYVSFERGKIVAYDVKNKTSTVSSLSVFTDTANLKRSMELAVSPDGKTLCVGNKNVITMLDTSLLRITDSFTFDNKSRFGTLQIQFNKEGNILYITELDGFNCNAYNLDTKQITRILRTRFGEIQNIQLSTDGRLLYINDFRGRTIINTNDQSIILSETDLFDDGANSARGIALAGDFSIGQAPSLTTLSPSTNQQVAPNQPLTIRWNTTVAPQSYSIASHRVGLSTDGGSTFNPIAKAEMLPADVQEFTWQVPDIEVLNKVQIRVSTVDLGARRANSTTGNFSITKGGGGQTGDTQAPTVTFLSPKGAERFTSGDNLQISWMSSDNVAVSSQDLSLSTDGGTTFPVTIASGLPGTTQSFSFPIPASLQSNQVRLRLIVRDGAGNTAQTITPSTFRIEQPVDTIAPVVTISQPSSNQSLIAGQPIQVNWQSVDNRAVVSQALLLSLDGGKTFATVASFGANDNSFVIKNIEELNITNSQGIVRITATDSSGNIGQA
ncbi:MAG: YD repeat-/RHS repeat-containing protein, partial [bacterium]